MEAERFDLDPRRISRREFVKTAGAASGALALGGIFTDVSSGAVELTKVADQLGWLKISQFTGFFAAQAKGFYKHEGIDVTVNAGGPNVIASQVIAAGKALVGDDDNTTVLQGIDKGLPLIVYGAIFQKSPYAVMSFPDKPIRTLKDFAGKTVAMSPATKPQLIPLLQKAGVDPNSVNMVPAGPDPGQLASHQVDGYFGYATATAGDVNGDGLDDVIVGAVFYDHGQLDEGVAFATEFLDGARHIHATAARILPRRRPWTTRYGRGHLASSWPAGSWSSRPARGWSR